MSKLVKNPFVAKHAQGAGFSRVPPQPARFLPGTPLRCLCNLWYPVTVMSRCCILAPGSPNRDTQMKAKSNITPAYLRTRDAAIYMGVSKWTFEFMRTNKTGPRFVKRNNIVLYKITDIDEWLTDKDQPRDKVA